MAARVISRGNAVPIVKVFKNALWTALWTILLPNMQLIAGFCVYSLTIFPRGDAPTPLQKRPHCLDSDTNFRLARQRSHCSCFTKRPPKSGPMTRTYHDINSFVVSSTLVGWQQIATFDLVGSKRAETYSMPTRRKSAIVTSGILCSSRLQISTSK